MSDVAYYDAKFSGDPSAISFDSFKGPDRDYFPSLAGAYNGDPLVVGTSYVYSAPLTFAPYPNERIDAGICIQGTASVDLTLGIAVCDGTHTVWRAFSRLVKGGQNTVIGIPWVLDQPLTTQTDWVLRLITGAGTFSISTGQLRWYLARLG